MFVSRGSHAAYMLQLVCLDLAPEFASLPEERDLDVLVAHYRWEGDFQAQAGTQFMDESTLISSGLPSGKRFLVWGGRAPDDFQPAEGPGASPTTPFSGFASIRNGVELLMFGVQGLGEDWSFEGVRTKATRIAFSTCFESAQALGKS